MAGSKACSPGCGCGRHRSRPTSQATRRKIADSCKAAWTPEMRQQQSSRTASTWTAERRSRAAETASRIAAGRTDAEKDAIARNMSLTRRGKRNTGDPALGFSYDRRGYRILHGQFDHPLSAVGGKVAEHRKVLHDEIGPGPHKCHWGERRLEWGGRHGIQADHLNGQTDDNRAANLVPSCLECNTRRRHAGNPADWKGSCL